MNTLRVAPCCLTALLVLGSGCAAMPAQPSSAVEPAIHALSGHGPVQVRWHDPAGFSEARIARRESARTRDAWMRELAGSLKQAAEQVLPAGERLEVTVTDVKRAGEYEPWRGPDHDDTRILRDLSPPRIALHYRHADAAGRTLAQGEAVLTDPAYLQAGAGMATASDPLRHEKRLLRDWVRSLAGHRRP